MPGIVCEHGERDGYICVACFERAIKRAEAKARRDERCACAKVAMSVARSVSLSTKIKGHRKPGLVAMCTAVSGKIAERGGVKNA